MAVANKYQGQPIAFIAINSGTPGRDVAKYLAKHKVPWPTIIDLSRAFEAAANVNEVSLTNIWQFRIVDPAGKLKSVGGDIEAGIDRVLETAAWNVDPTIIPDPLKDSWLAIEFGNFSAAAKTVTRMLNNKKPEIKTAATALHDFVQQRLAEQLAIAAAAQSENNPWLAFQTYNHIETQFKGYEIATDFSQSLAELAKNETVIQELAAQKIYLAAMRQLQQSGPARAAGRLKKLAADYPETEAGMAAKKLLEPTGN